MRTSVRETTPESFPDMRMPGKDAAEIEGLGVTANGGREFGSVVDGIVCVCKLVRAGGGTSTAGWEAGVGGPDEEGEGESTIHILTV